ncbi:MAG: preprotein translocase subunit SecG [Clostridia bacterium]|nr:preprotein translocase subunit SecG [Clostridia bacterium]
MNPTVELILTILQVLVCVVITVLILLQNGKSEGLGSAMSGAAETFFGKNKGRSVEAKLQKVTVILAVAFILLTAVLAIF